VGRLLHLVQEGGGLGGAAGRPLAVSNVTTYPSVNGQFTNHCIAVGPCYGLLLCGFNVPIKGLKRTQCIRILLLIAKMSVKFIVNV